jgi:hypothetical protein
MFLYLLGKEIIFVTVTALISLSALESLSYDSDSSLHCVPCRNKMKRYVVK